MGKFYAAWLIAITGIVAITSCNKVPQPSTERYTGDNYGENVSLRPGSCMNGNVVTPAT